MSNQPVVSVADDLLLGLALYTRQFPKLIRKTSALMADRVLLASVRAVLRY